MSGRLDDPNPDAAAGKAGRGSAATPKLLRRLNAARVLDAVRSGEPMRVSDLVARTRLSRPTVDAVADDLIRLGWVAEIEDDPKGPRGRARGRPARRLAFRADAGHVLGVDIGEHKVRAAVADLRGDVIATRTRALDQRAMDGRTRLELVRRTIGAVLKGAGVRRVDLLASCVGCTGAIDVDTGEVLFSGAFPGLDSLNLRTAMERSLGRGVLVENDCNLAMLGERWRGVAQGVDDAICVLASERMGAGIIVSGKLVRGHAGAAGEMPFLGAYEREHGAEGIAYLARTYGAAAIAGGPPSRGGATAGALWDAVGGDPGRVDAEAVFEAARAGDPLAADIVDRSLRDAGRAIVTMALVLNPELVVLGGGVARAGEVVIDPLRRQLAQMVRLPPRLEASTLGEHGVVTGAIRHALDHLEPRALDRLHEAA